MSLAGSRATPLAAHREPTRLALRWGGHVSHVFLARSAALAAFGLINAGAVAGGAWFGPIGWPHMRARPVSPRR